jgi:hypothetical protein
VAGSPQGVSPPVATPTFERINPGYHAAIGVAIGLISLFTVFAWPFAILTGMVIGQADVERRQGRPPRARVLRILAVTGGVLAMLFFGAFLGGLIAFFVMALAASSERIAGSLSPTDRTTARIVMFAAAIGTWIVLALVFHFNVHLSIGG